MNLLFSIKKLCKRNAYVVKLIGYYLNLSKFGFNIASKIMCILLIKLNQLSLSLEKKQINDILVLNKNTNKPTNEMCLLIIE